VSRMVRVIAMASLVLTLISWGFGISAMLHPVSCPGAFIGCSENGEETSYYVGYLVDILTLVVSILALMLSERRPENAGKWLFRMLLVVSLAFSPFVLGFFLSIFLATFLPGYGIFAFLLIPLCINLTILARRVA
jgi:hypothetical protein